MGCYHSHPRVEPSSLEESGLQRSPSGKKVKLPRFFVAQRPDGTDELFEAEDKPRPGSPGQIVRQHSLSQLQAMTGRSRRTLVQGIAHTAVTETSSTDRSSPASMKRVLIGVHLQHDDLPQTPSDQRIVLLPFRN